MVAQVTSLRVYRGNTSEITFDVKNNQLAVSIQTPHLLMRSVTPKDYTNYLQLFRSPEVMEKYATGKIKTAAEVMDRIQMWVKRWQENDPFSALAVYDNSYRIPKFVGHVVLGHGDAPGESEVAALFLKNYWNKGLGTEVGKGLAEYALAIAKEGYKLEGKLLEKIVATSRLDNPASLQLIQNAGMHLVKKEEKFGAMRNHYEIPVNELCQETSEKTQKTFWSSFWK